ncbi:MAG: ceramidase domain-containing protein, partial [Gammaproteobacteria bacterium]|nr:ceramidase domain-containing protein [Gammaproteobacteria bacterium]
TILGIPNFWNTATNLPFLLVGIAGLRLCAGRVPAGALPELGRAYTVFFAGVALLGIGSIYYHLSPTTSTLLWDRLAIAVTIMALLSIVVGESIAPRWGRRLLLPLLAAGVASVVYWGISEARGAGDLRPYALVQFLPLALIPLILLTFGSALTRPGYLWAILVTYAIAKVAEHHDVALFEATGILSGHSIKHLIAGVATFWMIPALLRRRRADPDSPASG